MSGCLWLPYTQMKTAPAPLRVVRTEGARIELADGRVLLDGIASWWTACHGYNHPRIADAVRRQLDRMPHVMFAGLVHEPALALAERLVGMLSEGAPRLERVFFTESGSVAVEVAMKMAVQASLNRGRRRTRFVSFRDGYHGDTFATMSVCDPDGGMHARFAGVLPAQITAELPRDDASEAALDALLGRHAHEVAAILVEPLVQGAGGMVFHAADTLRRVRRLADRHGVLLIADEIFTGFGRTGAMFACQAAGVAPDIVTLSKALTGGTLPLAATVASAEVFAAFWSDDAGAALMHGPTYMANPLACAAALASLALFDEEPRLAQVASLSAALSRGLEPCRALGNVRDVRVLGAIGVVELEHAPGEAGTADLDTLRQRFVAAGVWLRPFGRIVYLTPAFTLDAGEIDALTAAVREVLCAA
ncbi:MAG: adenosylmethionine--8-amino-7-oxononanoate transaminase [Janthinobacterium lividum]